MLLIKTKIGPSKIHGTGAFAAEFVPKGAIIWQFTPNIDSAYTPDEVEKLPEPKRSEVLSLYYTYISKQTGRYIDCGDNAKYMNHSLQANIGSKEGAEEDVGFALQDINEGDEITVDYGGFAQEGTNF